MNNKKIHALIGIFAGFMASPQALANSFEYQHLSWSKSERSVAFLRRGTYCGTGDVEAVVSVYTWKSGELAQELWQRKGMDNDFDPPFKANLLHPFFIAFFPQETQELIDLSLEEQKLNLFGELSAVNQAFFKAKLPLQRTGALPTRKGRKIDPENFVVLDKAYSLAITRSPLSRKKSEKQDTDETQRIKLVLHTPAREQILFSQRLFASEAATIHEAYLSPTERFIAVYLYLGENEDPDVKVIIHKLPKQTE